MSEQHPIINKHKYISPVWILPIIAALLGGWLMIESVANKGIEISIHFNEAVGIKPGKTKILYKGLEVGHVVKLHLDDKLEGVEVIAEIDRKAASLLRSNTVFWLVSPQASLTGISGLDTLVSGNYIDILPGEGEATTHFAAVDSAPIAISGNGLAIRLISDELGSLSVGAPIYYKRITVGEIHDFKLAPSNDKVIIDIIIEEKYADLVKNSSRFWNISGVQAELSADGLKVQLDGIASLIAGGIAFDSPNDSPKASAHQKFTLYPNLQASQRGIEIVLSLPPEHGLKVHSKLLFNDIETGEITQIHLNGTEGVTATMMVDPSISAYLNSGSTLYLIKPSIGLTEVKNLARLISGNYIGLKPGHGTPQTQFSVISTPPLPFQGKTITLTTEQLNGIKIGTPVRYLDVVIGQVTDIALDPAADTVKVQLLIDNKYQMLLTNARFYLCAPIRVNADLDGIELESSGIDGFLQGQISLVKQAGLEANFQQLFPSKQSALLAKDSAKIAKPLQITLTPIGQRKTLTKGAPVYYQGLQIGQLLQSKLLDGNVQYSIVINDGYQHLVGEHSVFWYKAPVSIEASLSGISINSAPLIGMLKGGFEMANIAIETRTDLSHFPLFDNYNDASTPKVAITLLFDHVRGVNIGTTIRYKGLEIGKVEQLWLSYDHKKIQARAYIYKKYAKRFTLTGAKYWIVEPEIALSGVENLDTLIKGAFIQAMPATQITSHTQKAQHSFNVAASAPLIENIGLSLKLVAASKDSINVGTPVLFRQMKVGAVSHSQLSADATQVIFNVEIDAKYAHLVRQNSQFWNVSGFNVDFGFTGGEIQAESLETIITGGITFSSPNGNAKRAQNGAQFTLHPKPESSWTEWDPALLP